MAIPDGELLRRYGENQSEEAFAELVRRHVDLVYSAALRQLNGDAHLAQDVAQNVFGDLARKVAELSSRRDLAGWLYTSTHFAATKAIRTESRRRAREQEAQAMHEILEAPAPAPDWTKLQAVLDEAMHELNETEREAVILRYFQNQHHALIGEKLGLSENAARMRIDRAVEKLRGHLTRRGITATTAALSVVISANAVQAAPVGLAITISTAATLAGTTVATATVTATKAIAMTTLQKTLIAATLAALAGVGIYEARQASQSRAQLQTLQQQQALLIAQLEQLEQLERNHAEAQRQLTALRDDNERLNRNTAELLKLRGEVARLRNSTASQQPSNTADAAVRLWLDNLERVKAKFEEMPGMNIPELRFLSDYDWLQKSRYGQGEVESFGEKAWRGLLAELRLDAKMSFAHRLGNALDEFIAANDGQLPVELAQLNKYYDPMAGDPPTMEAAILERYQLVQSGNLRSITDFNTPIIVEKAGPADDSYDTSFKISVAGYSYKGVGTWEANRSGNGPFNSFTKVTKFKTPKP